MKKKIYIHIGYPKTGTTSVQIFFMLNQEKLKKYKMFYPILDGQHRLKRLEKVLKNNKIDMNSILKVRDEEVKFQTELLNNFGPFHHALVFNYANNQMKFFCDVIQIYDRIIKEFEDSGCESMILSSEMFSGCDQKYIKSLYDYLSGYDCHIVLYAREIVKSMESNYAEGLKTGHAQTCHIGINTFFEKNISWFSHQNQIILQRYGSVFGKENIIARLYDKNTLVNHDTVQDFMSIFGYTEKIERKINNNESLKSTYIHIIEEILRLVPELNQSNDESFIFKKKFIMSPLQHLSSNRLNDEQKILFKIVEILKNKYQNVNFKTLEEMIQLLDDNDTQRHLLNNSQIVKLYNKSKMSVYKISQFMPDQHAKKLLSYYHQFLRDQILKINPENSLMKELIMIVTTERFIEFTTWWFQYSCASDCPKEWIKDFFVYTEHCLEERSLTPLMVRVWKDRPDLQKAFPEPFNIDNALYWEWWIGRFKIEYQIDDVLPFNIFKNKNFEKMVYTQTDTFQIAYNNSLEKPSRIIQMVYHCDYYYSKKYITSTALISDLIYELYSMQNNLHETFTEDEIWDWWLSCGARQHGISHILPLLLDNIHINNAEQQILMTAIWNKRKDLQTIYPDPFGQDYLSFIDWWNSTGYGEYNE